MCEKLFTAIKENDADVVVCGYKRVDGNRSIYKKSFNKKIFDLSELKNNFGVLLENALFNPPWNKLYRKDKIKGGFNETISVGEDLLFNLNYFSGIKKIVLIDFCPYNYIVSKSQSLSSIYNDSLFETQLLLDSSTRKFCMNYFGQTYSQTSLDRVFAKEIYYLLKRLVILNNEARKSKIKKIKKIINNKRVKKISHSKNIFDKQIKIINFFIRRNWYLAIYAFFYLKKVVMSK